MSARIMICVPCKNRKAIAELCLPTLRDSKKPEDFLWMSNDGSTQYDGKWLAQFGDMTDSSETSIGIDAQRRKHFERFAKSDFTHLYLTDCDAIHDPTWRAVGLKYLEDECVLPVCLYNTDAHVRLVGNTITDNPLSPVIARRVAPGISYFLTREMALRVALVALPHLPPVWHWDWTVPNLLGGVFAVSRSSYVDHIGYGGDRHPKGASLDEGDRALNPTPFLVQKRAEIVKQLSS